jgi:hypothetical protein
MEPDGFVGVFAVIAIPTKTVGIAYSKNMLCLSTGQKINKPYDSTYST